MAKPNQETAAPDSLKQPVWHVLVLCWVTSIAYLIYWSYKNWRDFSKQAALAAESGNPDGNGAARKPADAEQAEALKPFKDISPMLRSIGLLVWGLNLFLSITQFLGIAQLVPDENSLPRRRPLMAALLIYGSFISLTLLFCCPPPIFFLGTLLCPIPFAVVQHWVNRYWDSVEPPGRAMRHAFSVKELIVIIFGGMLQGLIVAGYMLGLKP